MKALLPALLLLCLSLLLTPQGAAHEPPLHPAATIAEKYLRATHLHDWKYAAQMIETVSLENLKRLQFLALRNAPTIPDEENLLRALGLKKVAELEALSAQEVFVRRAQANAKQLEAAGERLEQMQKSLKMTTLGTVKEGDNLVHTLLRVSYSAADRIISELAMVSLIKEGTVWKVSLDAQEPQITRRDPKDGPAPAAKP